MRCYNKILIATFFLTVLSSCGAGGEMPMYGKIIEIDSEHVVIEPMPADAELGVPYYSELDNIERIAFSREKLDEKSFDVGDSICIIYDGNIQEGDPCWVDAVEWGHVLVNYLIGRIVEIDSEHAIIEPISDDEELDIPYMPELDGIDQIQFSRENLREQGYTTGDIIMVDYYDEIQDGDPCWIDVADWGDWEP